MDRKSKLVGKNKLMGQDLLNFIEEYRQHECLWNSKSKNYKKLDLKKKCYLDLANKFDLTIPEVKSKINNLRSNFNREYNKIKRLSDGEVYSPKLYWYDEMSFVKDELINSSTKTNKTLYLESIPDPPRKNSTNSSEKFLKEEDDINSDLVNFEDEYVTLEEHSMKGSIKPTKIVYTQEPDEFEEFFKGISAQIKTLPKTDAYELMLDFQTLVTRKKIENEIKKKKHERN